MGSTDIINEGFIDSIKDVEHDNPFYDEHRNKNDNNFIHEEDEGIATEGKLCLKNDVQAQCEGNECDEGKVEENYVAEGEWGVDNVVDTDKNDIELEEEEDDAKQSAYSDLDYDDLLDLKDKNLVDAV